MNGKTLAWMIAAIFVILIIGGFVMYESSKGSSSQASQAPVSSAQGNQQSASSSQSASNSGTSVLASGTGGLNDIAVDNSSTVDDSPALSQEQNPVSP